MLRRVQQPIIKAAQQKRFQSTLQVFTDAPRMTTDLVVAELNATLDQAPYQSRHPDVTFDDYEAQLKAELSKPVFYDEGMVKLVHKALDFPESEVRNGFAGKMPELYHSLPDGTAEIDWKVILETFSRSDRENTRMDEMEKFFRNTSSVEASLEETAKSSEEIDWKDWEKRIGAKTAQEIRAHFEQTFANTKPTLDLNAIEACFDRHLQPMLDAVKDDLVDKLPLVKAHTASLVKESQLLRVDEYGMPVINFDSPHFLDEYYPQQRDEIIQEIEDDAWDTNYAAERKKLRMAPDDLTEYNREWVSAESAKLEEADAIKIEGGAGLTPQKREEEMIFKDVMEMHRRAKVLEAEVSSLRLQREFEADEQKAAEGDKKEEVDSGAFKDSDWEGLLATFKTEETDLRDFKHMSREEIAEWTKNDAEIRGHAEAELARVQKGGKL